MTREEEITQAAMSYRKNVKEHGEGFAVGVNRQYAFEAGAQWADEHPKSPWISVEDKLPADDECVLSVEITGKGKCHSHLDYYDSESGEWDSGCEMVSYWMPIPELPKGK